MNEWPGFYFRVHVGVPWWELDVLVPLLPHRLPVGMWEASGSASPAIGAALRVEEFEAL